MNVQKIYLETTLFNYYFDEARDGHDATIQLFEAVGRGEYIGYTSEYVLLELRSAPEHKMNAMLSLIERYNINVIDADDEAARLADVYVHCKMIPAQYRMDGAHIAIASINELDCILSFNFQHINKLKTKRMTELINLNEGYKGIIICTPMEILEDEEH